MSDDVRDGQATDHRPHMVSEGMRATLDVPTAPVDPSAAGPEFDDFVAARSPALLRTAYLLSKALAKLRIDPRLATVTDSPAPSSPEGGQR